MKILVVDDDALQRKLIEKALSIGGHDVMMLDNAEAALNRAAERYSKAVKAFSRGGNSAPGLKTLNAQLIQTERRLTNPDGLPRRPWYQHLIYAPGFYTGYGVKTVPAVREAIEQKQWSTAEESINTVAKALENEATAIEKAAIILEHAIQ